MRRDNGFRRLQRDGIQGRLEKGLIGTCMISKKKQKSFKLVSNALDNGSNLKKVKA